VSEALTLEFVSVSFRRINQSKEIPEVSKTIRSV